MDLEREGDGGVMGACGEEKWGEFSPRARVRLQGAPKLLVWLSESWAKP